MHGERCGGCPLIHLSYGEQLGAKRGRLTAALARYPALAQAAVDEVIAADTITAYRTRAKLAVAPKARLGLYRELGHHVVDIPECRVLSPALAAAAAALRALLADPPPAAGAALVPYARRGKGALVGVDLRQVCGEHGEQALATLIVARERSPSQRAARAAADALMAAAPAVIGVALSRRAALSPRFLGDAPEPVAGAASALDRIGEVAVSAVPGAFVQAHRQQAARLGAEVAARVHERLGGLEGRRVLELFAGAGAIGLGLARGGAKVTLVESNPAALAIGADGAAEVVVGDALEAARRMTASGERFDAVVVDPPRRGLSPALRAAVAALAARALIYVSCDPRTLARDLGHLGWLGLAPARLQPLDMIPLSEEVEVIATLAPAPPPALRVLYRDGALLAVDKPPHLAMRSLGELVRALAPDAVPLYSLDGAASGVCLFGCGGRGALDDASLCSVAWAKGITRARGAVSRAIVERGRAMPARTTFTRDGVRGGHSLLRVTTPLPARKQQLRRHLAAIGHPLVGDRLHGHEATNRHFEERAGLDRPFLHAARLELRAGDRRLVIESPLAGDLEEALAGAGG